MPGFFLYGTCKMYKAEIIIMCLDERHSTVISLGSAQGPIQFKSSTLPLSIFAKQSLDMSLVLSVICDKLVLRHL